MLVHHEEYKGRKMSVYTQEKKKGLFTWSYTIDARIHGRSEDRAMEDEDWMLDEGIQYAKMRIDAMSANFEYKGHQIEIVTNGEDDDQWSWSYTIDSGKLALSESIPSMNKASAIEAAKTHARRNIDENY